MIDYLIKLDYVLGYERSQKRENAFKPEDTCLILMDVKMGNIGILSIYFLVATLKTFEMLDKTIVYVYGAILLIVLFRLHFKIDKRIYQSPIRKTIKKMSEDEKKKYVILSYVYSLGSILLWILAFTWPVILYGTDSMV